MADKHQITISDGTETKVFEITTEKLATALSDVIALVANSHDKVEVLLDSSGGTTSVIIEKLGSGDGYGR